jgi:hypothetical protein
MPDILNFHGHPVSFFNPRGVSEATPHTVCVYLDYDFMEQDATFLDLWESFEAQIELEQIEQLIIGVCDYGRSMRASQVVSTLNQERATF